MKYIQKIEINHFRSINKLVIEDLSDINVLSGLNDVGKSNVIKALNLFFNNQVDWQTNLDFERDTNTYHAYFSRHARKKKHILVRLTFNTPKRYKDSLNESFWVEREWSRENPIEPKTTWGMSDRSKMVDDRPRALTWFLKKCRFFYVPAIRDRHYLLHLLGQFSEEITEQPDNELKAAGDNLLSVIQFRSLELRDILNRVTGLDFTFELPETMLALMGASGLSTDKGIPLNMRGDGIQGLTVPGILQYLSNQSPRDFLVWGFEEPENSLEYRKAAGLADDIREIYSNKAQVFLTTHSPAFLTMEHANTTIYRVGQRADDYVHKLKGTETVHTEQITSVRPVFVRGEFRANVLPEELGLIEMARKYNREMRGAERLQNKVSSLEDQVSRLTTPILLVEGPNDKRTLEHAWERLYTAETRIPLAIQSAEGVNELKELAKRWDKANARRLCALFDHDKSGLGAARAVFNSDSCKDTEDEFFRCTKGNVLVMTLPSPQKETGAEQAKNLNLTTEFYFPDSVLYQLHHQTDGGLFSDTHYMLDGEKKENHPDLRPITSKAMKYKSLEKTGKKALVDCLEELHDEDFMSFHPLFESIVQHLSPDFELRLKLDNVERQLQLNTESRN